MSQDEAPAEVRENPLLPAKAQANVFVLVDASVTGQGLSKEAQQLSSAEIIELSYTSD
jgi:hypothetical protein